MEAGLAAEEVAILSESDAALCDDRVEVGKRVEVLVGEGLVDWVQRVSSGCSSGV